jgi:dihydroxy-acid dehydratase
MATDHRKINRTSLARHTEDVSQPGSRAMLYAAGPQREDLGKPQVGIASTGYEPIPATCTSPRGRRREGRGWSSRVGWLELFNTIGSATRDQGHQRDETTRCPRRDLIAASIEAITQGHSYDANVSWGLRQEHARARDGHVPHRRTQHHGLRRHHPAGRLGDRKLDIISAFEAYGQYLGKQIDEAA